MGCCAERRVVTAEERLICYEEALGFNASKASQITQLSRKFSKNSKICLEQFLVMSQELMIPKNSLASEFLFLFFDEEKQEFDSQVLTTLGILLASGELEEKVELLFRNYDTNCEGFLNTNQVRLMVNHIIYIATDKMCEYTYKKTSITEKYLISEYKSELLKSKSLISFVYINNLIGNFITVSKSDFIKGFFENDNETLLNLHRIRTIGTMAARNMVKLSKKVNKVIEDSLDYDKSFTSQLSIKIRGNGKKKDIKRFKSTSDIREFL